MYSMQIITFLLTVCMYTMQIMTFLLTVLIYAMQTYDIFFSSTGHNADDIAETIVMNVLRGDVARLSRCSAIETVGIMCDFFENMN